MTDNNINENVDNNVGDNNVNSDNIMIAPPVENVMETTPDEVVAIPPVDVNMDNNVGVDGTVPSNDVIVPVDSSVQTLQQMDNIVPIENVEQPVPTVDAPVENVEQPVPMVDALVENVAPVDANAVTVDPNQGEPVVDPTSVAPGEVAVTSEPVIQKVIDVDKQKRMRLIIVGVVAAVVVIALILVFVLSGSKKSKSTINHRVISNDYSAFVNAINNSKETGLFDKEINKALRDVDVDTNSISLISIDIDSDNDYELVGFVEDKNKNYILQFEIYDGDVLYEDNYQVDSKDSLTYAYSIKEDYPYWTTNYVSEYTIIKHPKRVLKSIDYLDGYYEITKKYKNKDFFDNAIEYKSGSKIDALKLEKNQITYKKILEDKKLTEANIKDSASKYKSDRENSLKEEENKKNSVVEESNDNNESNLTININGLTIHYGQYHESATILYGNFVLHQNGSCEIGGNSCSWSFGTYDFGKGQEQSIDVNNGSEVIHLTSHENDTLTNGATWSAVHQG